jgi:anti-anti-sigma factor
MSTDPCAHGEEEIQRPAVETDFPTASVAIVRLIGEHDLGAYEPLKEALETAAARRRHVFIDLSRCAFIDSTVVCLLLHAQGEVVSDRGQFGLILPQEAGPVRRIADIMGLAQMFPICASADMLPARDSAAHPAHVSNAPLV